MQRRKVVIANHAIGVMKQSQALWRQNTVFNAENAEEGQSQGEACSSFRTARQRRGEPESRKNGF
jgi:hypothetical protein